jgi:hypothetical protein
MATIQKRLRYRASVKVNGSPEEAKRFGREVEARRWVREKTAAAVEEGSAPEAVVAEVRQKTSYRVMVRLRGHPAQYATFTRKTNAAKWAQKTEAAIREGRHFNAVESRKHTVADLIDRYRQEVLSDKPEAKCRDQERHLRWWGDQLGSYRLSDVTPALISEQRSKLARGTTVRHKKRSPATVNRYLISLSHVFTVAVREWGWLEQNPVQKVSKLKEPRGRVRFLSDEEREALIKACKDSTGHRSE